MHGGLLYLHLPDSPALPEPAENRFRLQDQASSRSRVSFITFSWISLGTEAYPLNARL